MITNSGKKIIGKFLLSQTNQFATHIAAGCGPKALTPSESLSSQDIIDIKAKNNLDFEMFRVPIISKGFVKENGVEKIVFKAEMPTDQRYQITEVGFFPSNSNVVNGAFDSKTLATFNPAENWVLASDQESLAIDTVTSGISDSSSNLTLSNKAAFIPSDASVFDSVSRKDRQEQPRFYNRALIISGDAAFIDNDANVTAYGYRVENSTLGFNFSQNSPDDEIRLGMSLLSVTNNNNAEPDEVRIKLQFINNIQTLGAQSPKATVNVDINSSDLNDSRYQVVKIKLSSFQLDDGFSWANVNLIRIFVSVIEAAPTRTTTITNVALNQNIGTVTMPNHSLYPGMKFNISGITGTYNYFNQSNLIVTSITNTTVTFTHPSATAIPPVSSSVASASATYFAGSNNYKVILDGMRLENNSINNPLYSLVGYDIVKNDSGYPVVKTENSNNYIEYRFGVGVDVG